MKKLNENKNGKVVTFDFDNTIVKSFDNVIDQSESQGQFGGLNPAIIERIKKFMKKGITVFVVSSRNVYQEVPESSIDTILKQLNLDVSGVFYTNGEPKAQKLYELGSSLHYDDDPREHEAIKAYGNLHQNFNISVKYPNELLSDIEEVSKGLIMTTDGKFIIVQRSDSHEWDAAGGHLLQGEEAPYAFWREVKEETGLDVTQVEHLETKDTVWKKQNQLVHYFIGQVPYSCEELEGAASLQWELADYFCGEIEELEEKISSADGATENLNNVLSSIGSREETLFEAKKYQQRIRKGHSKMKKRIIGLGGNKATGAKGLKKVKVFKRSKSAPPGAPGGGWAPSLEEKKDKKTRKKIKIKIKKELEEKKRKKRKKKRKNKKKTTNKYHWGVAGWDYGGGYGDGGTDGGGE